MSTQDMLIGILITTVYRVRGAVHTALGEVIDVKNGTLHVRAQPALGPFHKTVFPCRYDREGKTWIRGHHAPESEEAQALLATWILTRESR